MERTAIRVADLVVVRGSYYRSFLRYERVKRVLEIPDCVAVSTFTNDSMLDSQAREIRCSLGLQDVLVMGMVGSCEWNSKLGIAHGWEFIEAMQHLHGLPIHGIIIGDGDGIPRLRRRIAELGLETRVSLLGSIQREAIGPYVRMMDICLSTQPDDRIGWARTTDELVLYLVNNRFILASNVGQAACVLPPEMRVTYVGTVDREYPKRLAERVREIIREPQLLALGSRGRDVVRAQFDASRWRTRLAACLGLPLREIQAADV